MRFFHANSTLLAAAHAGTPISLFHFLMFCKNITWPKSPFFSEQTLTLLYINPGSKSKAEGEHHGASLPEVEDSKGCSGREGKRGGSKGQLDRVCAFLCKKYPLIFCGRFEMTWKQIGYAQRLSPDIRIIRNRVHECLMNAILKCFLDHFCRDLAYFGQSCMHISGSLYRPQHFTIVFAEI